jgi:leucyl aminopeptidase
MTKITVRQGLIQDAKADAIVVNLFKGVKKPAGATGAVDAALGGAISNLIAIGDFKGALKDVSILPTNGRLAAKRVILVGLGDKGKFGVEEARMVSARVATAARERGLKSIATIVHGAGIGRLKLDGAAYALAEGAVLGLYEYKEYKSAKKPEEGEEPEPEKDLGEIHIVESDAKRLPTIERMVRQAERLATITNDVRTLVNRPSMDKPPPVMAQTALAWAKKYGFSAKVLEKADLQRLKMGGLLGVGSGSQYPPRMAILEKKGRGKKAKTVLLVGKGITFDSGGISIKPAQNMDAMRHDMAGAAAVLGAVSAAAVSGVPHHVVGLLPLAENMPSGTAIRPGDILRSFDGTTIEVLNTDAEGRLVLADAIGYGLKIWEPDVCIDIATLTGAVKVALGTIVTGVFSNDDRLVKGLVEAGKRVGDALWRLPVTSEYAAHIKSDYADIKNTGTNWGGSITAAAFLHHFVGKTKWAHLDIAGTCWTEKGGGDLRQDYHAKGATGVGVRLFAEFLRSYK